MSRQMPDDTPTILVGRGGQATGPASAPPPAQRGGRTPIIAGGIAGCLLIVLLLACGGAAFYFLAGPGKASLQPTASRPIPTPGSTLSATSTTRAATPATAAATKSATHAGPTAAAATGTPATAAATAATVTAAPGSPTATVTLPAGLLAFASDRSGKYDIYVTDPKTPDSPKDLTADSTGANRHPAWAPDGQQIAFASDRSGKFEIYVMKADGSGVRQLTNDGPNTQPAWSHDGSTIAYAHQIADGTRDIYVIKPDGTGLRLVANDPHDDFGPQLSRDDAQLAFLSNRDSKSLPGTGELYLKPTASAGGARRVTPNVENALSVDYSPDGQWLIFAGKPDPQGSFQIFTIHPGGAGLTPLSHVAANESYPAYVPGGALIVFVSARGGNNNLFIMNADGSNQQPLTHASGDNIDPAWQPAP